MDRPLAAVLPHEDSENNSLLDNTPTSSPVKPVVTKAITAALASSDCSTPTSAPVLAAPSAVVVKPVLLPACALPVDDILVIGQANSDIRNVIAAYTGDDDVPSSSSSSPPPPQLDTAPVRKLVNGRVVSLRLITSAAQLNRQRLLGATGAVIACSRPTPSSIAQAAEWRRELDAACKVLGRPRLFCVLLSLCAVDSNAAALFDKVVVRNAGFAPKDAFECMGSGQPRIARVASMSSVTSSSSSSILRKNAECVIS